MKEITIGTAGPVTVPEGTDTPDVPRDIERAVRDLLGIVDSKASPLPAGGLPGQILSVNAAGDGYEWVTLTQDGGSGAIIPMPNVVITDIDWWQVELIKDVTSGFAAQTLGTAGTYYALTGPGAVGPYEYTAKFDGIGIFYWYANVNPTAATTRFRTRIRRSQEGIYPLDYAGYQEWDFDQSGSYTSRACTSSPSRTAASTSPSSPRATPAPAWTPGSSGSWPSSSPTRTPASSPPSRTRAPGTCRSSRRNS
jgi:hypothetical protein